MTRAAALALALLALAGAAAAATYPTVTAAVSALPELSTLGSNLQQVTALTTSFGDPSYVGTLFLPTNDAVAAVSNQIGGDFSSLISDNPAQAEEVFGYSVVPGAALTKAALKDGMTLKTKGGDTLAVSVKSGTTYINGIPIVKSDITAGKAIIHELGGLLLPPDLAQLIGVSTPSSSDSSTADPFASYVADDSTAAADSVTPSAATSEGAGVATTTDPKATTASSSAADEVSVAASPSPAVAAAPARAQAATTVAAAGKSGAAGAMFSAAVLAVPVLAGLLL